MGIDGITLAAAAAAAGGGILNPDDGIGGGGWLKPDETIGAPDDIGVELIDIECVLDGGGGKDGGPRILVDDVRIGDGVMALSL